MIHSSWSITVHDFLFIINIINVYQRAYHRLILPNGESCSMAVVLFDDNGRYISHHSLQAEEPFVEWHGGTLDLCQEHH